MEMAFFLAAWFAIGLAGGVHASVAHRRKMIRKYGFGSYSDPLPKFYWAVGTMMGPFSIIPTFITFGKDAWK